MTPTAATSCHGEQRALSGAVREALHTRAGREPYQRQQHPRVPETQGHLPALPRTTVRLLLQLNTFSSSESRVTIWHRCMSGTGLAWMAQDCPLSCEAGCFHGWGILAVTSHIATTTAFASHVWTVRPTLCSGRASLKAPWCVSPHFTSAVTSTGAK